MSDGITSTPVQYGTPSIINGHQIPASSEHPPVSAFRNVGLPEKSPKEPLSSSESVAKTMDDIKQKRK